MPAPPRRRTPVPRVLVGTVRMLARPALLGWLLKTLGWIIGGLTPLATFSAYGSVARDQRLALLFAASAVVVAAYGMHFLGRRLRSSGRHR